MLHPLEKELKLPGFDSLYRDALHLKPQGFRYTMGAPESDAGAIIIGTGNSRLKKANVVAVTIGSTLLDSTDSKPRPAIAITHGEGKALQVKSGAESLLPNALQIGALVVAKSQTPDNKNLWNVFAMDLWSEEEVEEVDLETEVDVNTDRLKAFLELVRGRSYSRDKEERPRHHQGQPGIQLLERELLLTNANLRLE